MADSNWLTSFPEMDRSDLRSIRKTLDGAYRDFSREYGDKNDVVNPQHNFQQGEGGEADPNIDIR